MPAGIPVTEAAEITAADWLLGIEGGTSGRVSFASLATQLAGSGAVYEALLGKVNLPDLVAISDRVSDIEDDYATATALEVERARIATLEATSGAETPQGAWAPSGGSFPGGGTAQTGDYWEATDTGTIDSVSFVAGDQIIALIDNASTSTFAGNWFKREGGAVTSVAGRTGAVVLNVSDVSGAAPLADGTHTGSTTFEEIDAVTGDFDTLKVGGVDVLKVGDVTPGDWDEVDLAEITTTPRPEVAAVFRFTGTSWDWATFFVDGTVDIPLAPRSIQTSALYEADKFDALPGFRDIDIPGDEALFLGIDGTQFLRVVDGRLEGPEGSPLATDARAARVGGPETAVGHVVRQQSVTVSTAETANLTGAGTVQPGDAVLGAWERMPYRAVTGFRLTNTLAEDVEIRRALVDMDGINYRGAWDPSSGALPIPVDDYRVKPGWFWHVSTDSGVFLEGDRVVFLNAVAGSGAFESENQFFLLGDNTISPNPGLNLDGLFFRVVRGGRFYRGRWDPASAAYPAEANLLTGDSYSVSAAGAFDGVTYAYGDYLVKTATGWTREAQTVIRTVAPAATLDAACENLVEWEIRRTGANEATPAELVLDVTARRQVTARVVEVDGNRRIRLYWEDGQIETLDAQNIRNNWAPRFVGSELHFDSDRSGEVRSYVMPMERIPGRNAAPYRVVPARSDTLLTVGDSIGTRWGPVLQTQVEHNDYLTARGKARKGVVLQGGSLDHVYISANILGAAEGLLPSEYMAGIVCYTVDWRNGTPAERAAIARAEAATRGGRFFVAGYTAARTLTWSGSAVVCHTPFLTEVSGNRVAEETALTEMMGGDWFEGGRYLNFRKWLLSSRNPRYNRALWDPVLQMSVADVADTLGVWSFWDIVAINADNYADLPANLTEANFQGYHTNVADLPGSATDWQYYVSNGLGDTGRGSVRYWKDGGWQYLGPGDGVHLPAALTGYGFTAGELLVTDNTDTSNLLNLCAWDAVQDATYGLAARGWLD